MGLPILGDIDNIYKITRDMVWNFRETNYFGENMVIVGCGNVNHNQLVELSEKHFANIKRRNTIPIENT